MASNSQYFLTANVEISAVPDTIPEVSGVSQFRFVRPATLASGAVTVNFTLGGTAIGGTDYATITATSVTLAVGATSATVQVTGLVDFLTEGGESVVLTQTAGAYPLNSPPTTTLTITDATVPAWTLTTNTVVLQQGANIVINGMMYGEIYTNTVDTYIDRAFPTNSYESATVLKTCGHDNIPAVGSSTRGFLRFDNLQDYVPSNAMVINARLRLTSAGDGVGDSAAGFFCRLAAWNPTNTWNALAGTASGQQLGSTIHGVWFAWAVDAVGETDLGAVVQAWMQGSLTNHGILFRSPEDNTTYRERRVYSSEYETISKRPKLTIVYAVTNAQVSPAGYERFSPVTRHVVALSGSNIIQDTYINGDSDTTKTSNYSTATMVTLQTRNGQGVKRALLQINTGSGLLSTFSASTAPTNSLNKRLVNAKLRLSVPSFFMDASPGIWTCNQPWSPTAATFYTRDGSTSWDQPWLSNANQNVGPLIGSFVFQYSPFLGGCAYVDVTSTLQAWINGTNNYGLVLGYTGSDYVSYVGLTEHAVPALRPTLVLEYYELPKARGAIIMIR
jgi:hypothetical protein